MKKKILFIVVTLFVIFINLNYVSALNKKSKFTCTYKSDKSSFDIRFTPSSSVPKAYTSDYSSNFNVSIGPNIITSPIEISYENWQLIRKW